MAAPTSATARKPSSHPKCRGFRLDDRIGSSGMDWVCWMVPGSGRLSPSSLARAAGFGNLFRDLCNEAGLPKGYAAHGLRKAAATRHANAGATAHELMAWFGWTSIREAERYTKAADRKRLAQGMVTKLRNRTRSVKPS